MTRAAVLLATGTFWAVMMTALVKREILPFFEYQSPPSYRTMFRDRRDPELERRTIYMGAEKRGTVESIFEPLRNGHYRTRTKFELKLRVPKLNELPMTLYTEVNVDPAFQLSDFTIRTDIVGMPMRVGGMRRGDKLMMNYGSRVMKGMPSEIDFPKDMTLSDGFTPYGGGAKLAVGKKWLVQTMDVSLTGLTPVTAFARVERRELKRWQGREVPTHVVEIRKRESDELPSHTVWVGEDGVVLVEQMSFDKLLYTIVLEEKRAVTAAEIAKWDWPRE
jgi:hypothetical protein